MTDQIPRVLGTLGEFCDAAVHAGLVQPGESAVVRVTVERPLSPIKGAMPVALAAACLAGIGYGRRSR